MNNVINYNNRYLKLLALSFLLFLILNISSQAWALAPGYCPSYGGSHDYEYISHVITTSNPDGTITITITVDVYIVNPSGCIYGNPCPEYDSSPEYVNAWIDWDGDNVWESHEKVMDKTGTGYANLNYHGTMSFVSNVTVPSNAVESTWMRTNLGWNHDPDDPCEQIWAWGDVMDTEVIIPVTKPEIEGIQITPKNPETTKEVTLEAKITQAPGYEIVKVSWAGDVTAGEGNPYKYTSAAGKHGKKSVTATLIYKHTATGTLDNTSKSKEFKLFFDKDGDEDNDGRDNWFEYWSASRDAACTFNCTSATYSYGGGSYTPVNFAEYNGNVSDPIYTIFNGATMNCGYNFTIPGYDFNNAGQGIDCVEFSLTHEKTHREVDSRWQSGGIWYGQADSDNDELPDTWEETNKNLGFDKNKRYSFSGFPLGDDEEVYCEMHASGQNGDSDNDWANPGKQTDPSFRRLATETGTEADLNGTYIDYGIDINGNSFFDLLLIDIGINVVSPGTYSLLGNLYDSEGNMLWAEINDVYLEPGDQTVTLNFEGLKIRHRRVDGPYNLQYLILFGNGFEKIQEDAYSTSFYQFIQFEPPRSEFSNTFSDTGIEVNGDGQYEYLTINTEINVIATSDYAIEGWIYDTTGMEVGWTKVIQNLDIGKHTVALQFDGSQIRQHRLDGPYFLHSLTLLENDDMIDFILDAYETSAYSYLDFQSGTASLLDNEYTDYGVDLDSDGYYDIFRIEETIAVSTPGEYTIIAQLSDLQDNLISEAEITSFYVQGNHNVHLDFVATDIYSHEADGPYILHYVLLYNESGDLSDSHYDAYITSPYSYLDFAKPLVVLTGNYIDKGVDTDDDSLYDYLSIGVEVLPTTDGHVVVDGKLIDGTGEEIMWVSEIAYYLQANVPKIIELHFDGCYIYSNLQNGPYYLSYVYAYHTGDPSQPDSKVNAHTTSAYQYTDFEMPCVITGQVLSAGNEPIENAFISAMGSDYDLTSSTGVFNIALCQAANYTVTIEAEGFEEDGWLIYINDQEAQEGNSANIQAVIGEIIKIDFKQKGGIIPGDINGDGNIDNNDFFSFLACYGSSTGDPNFNPAADLDNDGRITINDYRLLRGLI